MTDREWQDGDDSALVDLGYDEGYEAAMSEVRGMITKVLENSQIDMMPASMALRVLLASLTLVDED